MPRLRIAHPAQCSAATQQRMRLTARGGKRRSIRVRRSSWHKAFLLRRVRAESFPICGPRGVAPYRAIVSVPQPGGSVCHCAISVKKMRMVWPAMGSVRHDPARLVRSIAGLSGLVANSARDGRTRHNGYLLHRTFMEVCHAHCHSPCTRPHHAARALQLFSPCLQRRYGAGHTDLGERPVSFANAGSRGRLHARRPHLQHAGRVAVAELCAG